MCISTRTICYLLETTQTILCIDIHHRTRLYVALSLACRQMQWLQKAFADLRVEVQCALRCDNTSAISIAENDQVNDRTKHIGVHYHKVREEYRKGTLELLYVPTGQNLADICTETLPKPTHEDLASTVRCVR